MNRLFIIIEIFSHRTKKWNEATGYRKNILNKFGMNHEIDVSFGVTGNNTFSSIAVISPCAVDNKTNKMKMPNPHIA
jgi:hypothetical protein